MRRLTYWRRRWCAHRNHPQAHWSPIAIFEPAKWGADPQGSLYIMREEILIYQYRCALHDQPRQSKTPEKNI